MTAKTTGRVNRRTLLKTTGASRADRAAKTAFPFGAHVAQAAGPETTKANPRLHRADRCGAAVRRQGKGHLRQIRHARRRGAKQASWGATRDNLVLGSRRQRHRRRAYPDADAVPDLGRQGDAEQRADADVHPGAAQSQRPVHLGREGILRPQGRRRHQAVQGGAGEEEGLRQGGQGRDDLPRRHARSLDPLLARRRRHRSRQGHRDHRGAAAADGGEHEGRHDGLLLRLRAVEPAAHPPEHRLHRDHHRRALEQASRKVARHARRLRRQVSERRQGDADGDDGSAAVVREAGEPRRGRGDLRQAPVDQLPGRGRDRPRQGQVRLRHSRQGGRELAAHHALLE